MSRSSVRRFLLFDKRRARFRIEPTYSTVLKWKGRKNVVKPSNEWEPKRITNNSCPPLLLKSFFTREEAANKQKKELSRQTAPKAAQQHNNNSSKRASSETRNNIKANCYFYDMNGWDVGVVRRMWGASWTNLNDPWNPDNVEYVLYAIRIKKTREKKMKQLHSRATGIFAVAFLGWMTRALAPNSRVHIVN